MENVRTVRHLAICAEVFISTLAELLGLSSLTKFHASDMTDKTKQAHHQGRIIHKLPHTVHVHERKALERIILRIEMVSRRATKAPRIEGHPPPSLLSDDTIIGSVRCWSLVNFHRRLCTCRGWPKLM